MEKLLNEPTISDDTLITKMDGKKLKYFQLRNDFREALSKERKEYLISDRFQEDLPDIIVRFLGRKNIIAWGEQITGFKKDIFDKLLFDFSGIKKATELVKKPPIIPALEDGKIEKRKPPKNLPLFED